MMFKKSVVCTLLASVVSAENSIRGRELTDTAACGAFTGCYLWNISEKFQTDLTGEEDVYCATNSNHGWSVRCEGVDIEEITFTYNGVVFTETESPHWMAGDSEPTNKCTTRAITAVEYLSTRGTKEFTVEGRNGSNSPCFSKTFTLLDGCDGTVRNAPITRSNPAPTDAPTASPTKSPTESPTAPPTPPEMTSCARAAFKMYYKPNVPTNWQIEGINPAGESKFLDIQGTSPRPLIREEERWWHSFSTHFLPDHKTELRFVNEFGVAGPWHVCKKNSPIGLDLDGSGAVEHIEGQFTIDISGDGDYEYLNEWFAPTEGILIDVTHGIEGGVITGHHLFGDMGGTFSDGFAKLTLFDDNSDGVVSGDELEGFAIWTDANSNALLDDGELSSLADHNIVSISTEHVTYVSTATLGDGSTMYIEDLWFAR